VLVGHRISAERATMGNIGIDSGDKKLFSIEIILETITISKAIGVRLSRLLSLGNLLDFS
jgi:hypothetical protein